MDKMEKLIPSTKVKSDYLSRKLGFVINNFTEINDDNFYDITSALLSFFILHLRTIEDTGEKYGLTKMQNIVSEQISTRILNNYPTIFEIYIKIFAHENSDVVPSGDKTSKYYVVDFYSPSKYGDGYREYLDFMKVLSKMTLVLKNILEENNLTIYHPTLNDYKQLATDFIQSKVAGKIEKYERLREYLEERGVVLETELERNIEPYFARNSKTTKENYLRLMRSNIPDPEIAHISNEILALALDSDYVLSMVAIANKNMIQPIEQN